MRLLRFCICFFAYPRTLRIFNFATTLSRVYFEINIIVASNSNNELSCTSERNWLKKRVTSLPPRARKSTSKIVKAFDTNWTLLYEMSCPSAFAYLPHRWRMKISARRRKRKPKQITIFRRDVKWHFRMETSITRGWRILQGGKKGPPQR